MPVAVEKNTFESEVLKSSLPVLVDFWADWCAPCKMVAPVLDAMSQEYEGKLKIVKVDVDTNPELAETHQIISIPSLLLFKNGKMVEKKIGALPKAAILEFIQPHL